MARRDEGRRRARYEVPRRDPEGRATSVLPQCQGGARSCSALSAATTCSRSVTKSKATSISEFAGTVTDSVFLELRALIHAEFGFDPGKQHIEDAVYGLANHHRFHPVLDYLDGLTWDGTPRIDRWLVTYGGAEDTPYVRAVGAMFMIAAVRRVRKPGSKFDEMLVLESAQGWNKSLALRTLAVRSEWFTDQPLLGLSAKETIEQTSGKWIVEVAELQGMSKREVERIKAHLSSQKDTARLAYGRTTSEAKRQFVFVGTTNSDTYLRDTTGNRRYWPVRVQRFDVDAIERDRDQLWAEAAQREAEGASIRLPEELWAGGGGGAGRAPRRESAPVTAREFAPRYRRRTDGRQGHDRCTHDGTRYFRRSASRRSLQESSRRHADAGMGESAAKGPWRAVQGLSEGTGAPQDHRGFAPQPRLPGEFVLRVRNRAAAVLSHIARTRDGNMGRPKSPDDGRSRAPVPYVPDVPHTKKFWEKRGRGGRRRLVLFFRKGLLSWCDGGDSGTSAVSGHSRVSQVLGCPRYRDVFAVEYWRTPLPIFRLLVAPLGGFCPSGR